MKVLKKEQNLWKKRQQIQTGTEQIRQISGGVKKSLCASNIGEAEQEEDSRNNQTGGADSLSRIEKQIRERNRPSNRTESRLENGTESGSLSGEENVFKTDIQDGQNPFIQQNTKEATPNFYMDDPLDPFGSEQDGYVLERNGYLELQPHQQVINTRNQNVGISNIARQRERRQGEKQNVSETSTKTNPYGWGSTSGKNQTPWESSSGKNQIPWQSAGMDQASTTGQVASFSTMGGSTAGAAGGTIVSAGEVAGSTAGSVVAGSVGSTAGSVASGAAGGPVGVAVSSSVTLLQKGKELIEESLQRRQQQVQQRQSSDSGTGIGTYLLGGMAAFGILISVLICSIGAVLFSLSAQENSIVEVAKAEVEVWEDNIGGEKYKEWYGVNGNWCAMFVSWCSDQCGYIDDGIMPKTGSVNSMSLWYKERDQFEYKASGYEPKAGDIIFFQEEGASHTGIVIDYEPETSTVITIEGNTGSSDTDPYHEGSRVKEKRYPLTYSTISGYGLPEYPQNIPGASTESTELEAMVPKRYIAA